MTNYFFPAVLLGRRPTTSEITILPKKKVGGEIRVTMVSYLLSRWDESDTEEVFHVALKHSPMYGKAD